MDDPALRALLVKKFDEVKKLLLGTEPAAVHCGHEDVWAGLVARLAVLRSRASAGDGSDDLRVQMEASSQSYGDYLKLLRPDVDD